MADPAAFAEARLAGDETAAKAAAHSGDLFTRAPGMLAPEWRSVDRAVMVESDAGPVVFDEGVPTVAQADHMALHDPSRVLREVEAGRRILARHRDCLPWSDGPCEHAGITGDPPCPDLRDLLVRWADHPGYDPKWKPAGEVSACG